MPQQPRINQTFYFFNLIVQACLFVLLAVFISPLKTIAQTPDSFYPSTSTVYAMALQGDRKVLLGGTSAFMRVYQSGAIDTSFNRGCSGTVYAISEQADDSLIVAGAFSSLGGQACTNIARLRGDGSIDNGFSANITGSIKTLAIQQDGKLLVGGSFNLVNGQACTNLGRLFPDGSIDAAFNPGVPGSVSCITVQNDGKIIVGGNFTSLAGYSCTNIGRLNADGTFDLAINAMGGTLFYYPYYTTGVQTMSLQSDGKILVGGLFTNLAGQSCPNIGRLNPDGTLDNGFSASVSNGVVYSFAIQTDGKIYVGGSFTGLSGQSNTNIGRIYPDGTPDSSFSSPVTGNSIFYPYSSSGYVYSLALQDDGKMLIGGSFTSISGTTRNNIGRLNYFSFLAPYFGYDNSSITWMPQNCSPAFTKTIFEDSTNGTDWFSLGSGVLTTNGWQLNGATISSNSTIRARGLVSSGYGNGSSWFLEVGAGPLAIISQPISRTNTAGSQIGFSIQTVGQSPNTLQWFKNGLPLNDGGNIYGSSSSTLSVSNVLTADSGSYWVIASNGFGSITSMVATLTVISDPLIRTQPLSRTNSATTTATFTVGITGTTPLSYQWQKNGTNMNDGGTILGSTSSTLTLSNVFTSDIGGYSVIVTNQYGSISSSIAMLTIIDPSIISQPVGQTVLPGSNTTFSVTAIGTSPIYYQWQKDGITISGATNSTFVITNQQSTNTGVYSVVISNSVGVVTSSIAVLTINQSQTDAFNPTASPWVYTVAIQPDNKVLIGGWLTTLAGQSCANIGRVNSDGTADSTFNPGAAGSDVHSIAVQPDGKILVGGSFSTLGGQTHANLGRLNADGTLDSLFATGANSSVNCISLQPDGRILVGGSFSTLGGQSATYIGRLNQDGTLDASFTPGASGSVNSIAVQPDGKILVGGSFSKMGGLTCSNIARLNGDGTFDTNCFGSA